MHRFIPVSRAQLSRFINEVAEKTPSRAEIKKGMSHFESGINEVLQDIFGHESKESSTGCPGRQKMASDERAGKDASVDFDLNDLMNNLFDRGSFRCGHCHQSPPTASFLYEDSQIKLELSASEVTQIIAIAIGLDAAYSSVRHDIHIRDALSMPEQIISCEFNILAKPKGEPVFSELKISSEMASAQGGEYSLTCQWRFAFSDKVFYQRVAIIKDGKLVSIGKSELTRAALFLQEALNVFADYPERALKMIASVLHVSDEDESDGYQRDQISNWAGSILASYCHPDQEIKPLPLTEFNASMQNVIASIPQVKAALGPAGKRLQAIADAAVVK